MRNKAGFCLGYSGPEWDKKIQDKDNPNFWKYGVANLVFSDLIKERKRLLDIGCGTGGLTLFLAEQQQSDYILGVDPVRSMIEVARQNALQMSLNHKVDFVVCDGRRLPFRRSCFDALVSRGDAFVFLVPQKKAVRVFKRVLEKGGMVVIEIDNVRWKPGKIVLCGFEKMMDGAIAYSVERFDVRRNHIKVYYVLNPQSTIVKKISADDEFVRTGRLKREFALEEITEATVETRHGAVTHWPTVEEMRMLFRRGGFTSIEIFGDGLLMGLLQQGYNKVTTAMKRQPELFFEMERRLVPFIDPRKAHTIILKAMVPSFH